MTVSNQWVSQLEIDRDVSNQWVRQLRDRDVSNQWVRQLAIEMWVTNELDN